MMDIKVYVRMMQQINKALLEAALKTSKEESE